MGRHLGKGVGLVKSGGRKKKKNEKEKSTGGLGRQDRLVEGVGRSLAGEFGEVEEEKKI